VEDLLRWDENFYSGKVGGQQFLQELQQPGKLNSGKTLDYAKGLFVGTHRGLRFVEHGGSWGGYRAQLLRFPEQHFSIACLCNVGNADPERRAQRVADVVLASQMKEPPQRDEPARKRSKKETAALAPETLAAFAGDFWSEELRATYTLAVDNNNLMLRQVVSGNGFLASQQHRMLRPIGETAFVVDGEGLTFNFQRDGFGNPSGFQLDAGRTKGILFQRK